MLNVTVRGGDNVLMYDRNTGNLVGVITCSRIQSTAEGHADLQFRVTEDILVFREALVRKATDDVSKCPDSLMKRFAKAPTRRDSQPSLAGALN
tara:strand:+ start:329 stop:610 length:282 start_codon:yes stop_codon:yes gene_type:complete